MTLTKMSLEADLNIRAVQLAAFNDGSLKSTATSMVSIECCISASPSPGFLRAKLTIARTEYAPPVNVWRCERVASVQTRCPVGCGTCRSLQEFCLRGF